MNQFKLLAIVLLIPFLALTGYAVYTVGYIGVFDYHRHSPAGWQVFADLVISLTIVICYMVPEAKKAGKNPWLWVVVTLFLGAIGPLLYIIFGRSHPETSMD
ncbi:PLDc N-terminal domain-containing protein [Aliiglaciecola sp.]|nr:PLDc N-terminal domain-containing protein [Aliiglaciecola sp.]